MDATIATVILTGVGTGVAIVAVVYTFFRNFKIDMLCRFDKIDQEFKEMDKRVYITNQRMDGVYNLLLQKMGKGE